MRAAGTGPIHAGGPHEPGAPSLRDLVLARGDDLTASEQRVAEVAVSDPGSVAFGTVASLAGAAGVSKPTVVRCATSLGFEGFADMQAAVQEQIAARLAPAAERIRRRPATDPLAAALDRETANVSATLGAVDARTFARVVARLAEPKHAVAVVSGEAAFGVAWTLADTLGMLRDDVTLVHGSGIRRARTLAGLSRGDTLVAVDHRRYERGVVETVQAGHASGLHLVAVTDSVLSPIARRARDVFVVDAEGAGPFDSHVGTLALVNALVAGVAGRLRTSATRRLDSVERAWTDAGLLTGAD